jgi:hypothetical protein
VLVTLTLTIQLPAALLLFVSLSHAGVRLAPLWPIVALLAGNAPLGLRIAEGMSDRPATLPRLLVDLPYYTLWATCFGFLVTGPIAWVVAALAGARVLPVLQATFLGTAALATYAVFVRRHVVRTRRVEARVPGLAAPLDGYRIVQLSDLHVGSHVPPKRAARWVNRANAMRPDLVALTGDLISSGSGFLEATAETLGALRAKDGVFFSPGNHDYFCDHERFFDLLSRAGIGVLRSEGRLVGTGEASIWVAGADDFWTRRADVTRALADRPAGVPVVLLAHDPRLWIPARAHGAALTLAGHTHGGQVAIPFLARWLNLARTAFVHSTGVYREDGATLVVSNGLGTTGPPARLGAAPEIVEITLRRQLH